MNGSFQLYKYQQNAVNHIMLNRKTAFWADMGLGKTVTTIVAIDKLMKSLEVSKVLVIAPKEVALHTWPDEFKKWDCIHRLTHTVLKGTPAKRTKLTECDTSVHVIGVANLPWLVELLGKKWPYDCIIIDESSMFKNHSSKRFKSLKKVYSEDTWLVQLTGTPAPNGYADLWAQTYLLDKGVRLGDTISAFRNTYCNAKHRGMYTEFELKEDAPEYIEAAIFDLVFRLSAEDHSTLDEVARHNIVCKLPKASARRYRELEKHLIIEAGGADVIAANNAVLSNKLLQFCNGGLYDEEKVFHKEHDLKLDALERLTSSGENLLVAYQFKSDLERIMARFPEAVHIKDVNAIENWNAGRIKMLVAHPASAGHGLNLQFGGHVMVWFGLNWSLELYQQMNARLHRNGQTKRVEIYHIVVEGCQDIAVADALSGKEVTQSGLLEAMRVYSNERHLVHGII